MHERAPSVIDLRTTSITGDENDFLIQFRCNFSNVPGTIGRLCNDPSNNTSNIGSKKFSHNMKLFIGYCTYKIGCIMPSHKAEILKCNPRKET
jgi:hypothetical protein